MQVFFALLVFLLFLLPLNAQIPLPTTVPSDANARAFPAWAEAGKRRIEEAKASGKTVDLVFLGDSFTEQWLKTEAGLPLWKEFYADHALNFGGIGDGTEHLLWRLDRVDFSPFATTVRTVVVLIGTNDSTYPSEVVVAGIEAVVARSHALFPTAKTVVVGLPRNARADKVTQTVNEALKLRADGKETFYLDLPGVMTAKPESKSWKGLSEDRLHLSREGYALWAELLNAKLQEIAEIKKQGAEASASAPSSSPASTKAD